VFQAVKLVRGMEFYCASLVVGPSAEFVARLVWIDQEDFYPVADAFDVVAADGVVVVAVDGVVALLFVASGDCTSIDRSLRFVHWSLWARLKRVGIA
jgi:hypothetical protein